MCVCVEKRKVSVRKREKTRELKVTLLMQIVCALLYTWLCASVINHFSLGCDFSLA